MAIQNLEVDEFKHGGASVLALFLMGFVILGRFLNLWELYFPDL